MASALLLAVNTLAIATAIVVAGILIRRSTSSKKGSAASGRVPPGPKGLPFLGNLLQLGGGRAPLHRTLWQLSLEHGPIFSLKLGGVNAVVISSAELAKEVLKIKDVDLCSRPSSTFTDAYSLNRRGMLFAPYGDRWREVKKISMVELFSVRKVRSFAAVWEEEISGLVRAISASADNGAAVNLSKMLQDLTNSITCRVAFGGKYELAGEGHSAELCKLIDEVRSGFNALYLGDFFPALRWVDRLTGSVARLKKNTDKLFGYIEAVIADHRGRGEAPRPEHEEDIVDVLLRLQREEGFLTMDDIKALIVDIFLGGTETSALSSVWAMAELIRHPEIMKRAQDEVRGVVGAKIKVTEAHIRQLHYLNCVIRESFRHRPTVPMLAPRESIRDTSVGGYKIAQGTTVQVNSWAIGHDPKLWEDPDKFKPERFMGEKKDIDFKGQHFELITFGSGRRICPGMYFGLSTVEQVLANLLYWFDWKLPDGMTADDVDMEEGLGLVTDMKTPLRLVPVEPMLG